MDPIVSIPEFDSLVSSSYLSYWLLCIPVANVTDEEMQEHFDNFFEDVFVEMEDKVSWCHEA